ncbi:MAG: response regulator transcription factor [Dehalococcoidia bacterium]
MTTPLHHHERVLVVEDDATLRSIVVRNLRARGFWVDVAENVQAAIAAVEHAMPCLVLLDIDLPDRTGWDVLRDLRERRAACAVVMVTATTVHPDRIAEFAPDAVLPKPFPMDALLRLVASHCRPDPMLVREESADE